MISAGRSRTFPLDWANSHAAEEYLQFRNLKIQRDIVLAAWPDASDPGVLIDPVCFTHLDDQVLALRDLLGAARVTRSRGRGQPRKDLERAPGSLWQGHG
jgi:hypothetical protein